MSSGTNFNSNKSFHGFRRQMEQEGETNLKSQGTKVNSEQLSNRRSSKKSKITVKSKSGIKKAQLENEIEKLKLIQQKTEIESKLKIIDLHSEINEIESENTDDIESECETNLSDNVEPVNIENWMNDCDLNKTPDNINRLCEKFEKLINKLNKPEASGALFNRQVLDKDLPYFDGRPENWPLFISQLKRKIEICNYTDEEILMKLQKCLQDEALESVRGSTDSSRASSPGNLRDCD